MGERLRIPEALYDKNIPLSSSITIPNINRFVTEKFAPEISEIPERCEAVVIFFYTPCLGN